MSDFAAFLAEIGLSQAQMDAAERAMPAPVSRHHDDPFCVRESGIQGVGCFATRGVDGRIGVMRQGGRWHEAGRYINHSKHPNAVAALEQGALVAYGRMADGDEITMDYRQVRDCLTGGV